MSAFTKGYLEIRREGVRLTYREGEVTVWSGPYGITLTDPDSIREVGEWLVEKSRNPQGCDMCYGSKKVKRRTFDHREYAMVPCPSCQGGAS